MIQLQLRTGVVFGLLLISGRLWASEGPFAGSLPVPEKYAAGFTAINEADSVELLRTLVEGDMAGRGTGQEGYLKAARWFASQLESCGFQPAGDNGTWFQNVPFVKHTTLPDQCEFKVGNDVCIAAADLGISDYFGSYEGSLPVAFVRITKERPTVIEGQFAGMLLVIQSAGRFSGSDELILKSKPACVLVVGDGGRVRNEAVNRTEQTPAPVPVAMVTRTAAGKLATSCGLNSDFFRDGEPDDNLIVTSSRMVACRLGIEKEAIDVPNVIGWYPGHDESLRHEHICVGAHLDHLGRQRGDVYPGADDNGSGSAAVLQVARAIHQNPEKPRRSVLLMAFCAEERGLLGSKYYVENPVRPLKDMICMLNIDMIGRNEETPEEPASANENTIHLVGSQDQSKQFHELIQSVNQHVEFEFEYDMENVVDGRSDHASFSAKGIPVSFLFGGFNPHYHKPTDTMDGINFSKIANAARLDYLLLMEAAEHGAFEKNPEPPAKSE